MSQIIFDISANNHKNDLNTVFTMIDMISSIDSKKHSITFKHQLFEKSDKNVVLKHDIFNLAYKYAAEKGYKTTASVFDLASLFFLLQHEISFIKIACDSKLYRLIGEIPRKIPVYVSMYKEYLNRLTGNTSGIKLLACVPKYPAKIEEYDKTIDLIFGWIDFIDVHYNISDHTVGLDLFKKYEKKIGTYECHLKLDSSKGLDAGDWAKTPQQLEEIL